MKNLKDIYHSSLKKVFLASKYSDAKVSQTYFLKNAALFDEKSNQFSKLKIYFSFAVPWLNKGCFRCNFLKASKKKKVRSVHCYMQESLNSIQMLYVKPNSMVFQWNFLHFQLTTELIE